MTPAAASKAAARSVSSLRPSSSLHLTTVAITLAVCAMLLVAVRHSDGNWHDARMGALITFNLLSVVVGTLYYITWRLTGNLAAGWIAVTSLGIGLSELPFMLAGYAAVPARVPPGGEYQEVLAIWLGVGALWCGYRKVPFRFASPSTLALSLALTLGVVRALCLHWGEGELQPTSILGLTQRLVLLGGIGLTVYLLWSLDLPRRIRVYLVVLGTTTGLFSVLDTGLDEPGGFWTAVITLGFLLVMTEAQLEGALWLTVRALGRRQDELTGLAVRAATAHELVAQGNAVLDAVRSTVVPLAKASGLLQDDPTLPVHQREVLAAAMRREIDRINRTLGGTGSEPSAFLVDEVVGPLVEFHLAQGATVEWRGSGLTVVHDPDTVARAIGVSLSAVASAAPSVNNEVSSVVVHAAPPTAEHEPMTVRVFPHGLPQTPLCSVFVADHPEVIGGPQAVSLRSVERLLNAHGGGLRLLIPEADATSFGLEISLPFRPSARHLPIPRQR